MYLADPLLPLLALGPKQYKGWPKERRPRLIEYHPLSALLTRHFPGDAHMASYSVPSVPHRLVTCPPAYARIEGGVPMVVFHWDIDCAKSHRATGGSGDVHADDAWWRIQARRFHALFRDHPGGFAYRTRGGAHLVFRLAVPHLVTDGPSEVEWRRRYLAGAASLARRYGIVCDPSISDWPRVLRLPHTTRDGKLQLLEAIGDPYDVGTFEYDPTDRDEAADLHAARGLIEHVRGWAAALRILARNALPPDRRVRHARAVEHRDVDVGTWSDLAVDLGHALRRHHGRHEVHLALAGACFDRGLPLDMAQTFATAVCRSSGETDDRPQVWRTTADRIAAGHSVTGYGHLAQRWPDLAAVIDATLPSGGGAKAIRDELDALGAPASIPAAEAAPALRAAIASAKGGLSVVRVTEGSGKTRASIDVLRERARAVGDREKIPSSMKTLYVAPTHAVAAEVAEALRGERAVYLRSVLAAGGCAYHVPLARVTAARHAVQTWCEGWGMGYKGAAKPCEKLDGCPARAGAVVELGAGSPAVVVTVHALLEQGLAAVGQGALVIIDEDPDAIETTAITREELESAASAETEFARSERFRAPVLRALAAGLERGDLPTKNPLAEVFARGVEVLQGDAAWKADVEREYGASDCDAVLHAFAWRVVWTEYTDAKGTTWRRRGAWAPRPSKRAHEAVTAGTMSERFTASSLTHATVARLVAGVVQEKAPHGVEHDERAVAVVEVAPGDGTRRVLRAVIASPAVSYALRHRGSPTVLLDATADMAVVRALAEGPVPVTDVRVADGAPVGRRLLFWAGASRKHVLAAEAGEIRWGDGLERYLRVAFAQVVLAGARRMGLFTWKALADRFRAPAGDPAADPIARALLDELAAQGVTVTVGHYGNARGRNDWADCDALVSVGDPKPNVGAARAIAAVLGLSEQHDAVYRRATAAELSQVAGRLRAPWRRLPATHVHVGTVPPASWDSRADVLELPKGTATELDPAAALMAVRVYGSQRLAAAILGVHRNTVSHSLKNAENAYSEGCYTLHSETPSEISQLAVHSAACNTLVLQRFSVPEPVLDDAALIERLGGAPKVSTLLGVNRATVYHWIAGRRPMPEDARQSLLRALHTPETPQRLPPPAAPTPGPVRAPGVRAWFDPEVTDVA